MPIDSLIVCACSSKCWAVWPSPYPRDACFQAAGFLDQCDDTSAWCSRYHLIIDRAIEWLDTRGSLNAVKPVTGLTHNPVWRRILMLAPMYSRVHFPVKEQLELSSSDDAWPGIKLVSDGDFILETNAGHRIFWVTSASSNDLNSFVHHIADGLAIKYGQLEWELLCPPDGFAE